MTDNHSRSFKKGLGPGELVYVGEAKSAKVSIHVMDFTLDTLQEIALSDLSKCAEFGKPDSVSWIDVDGIHDPAVIEAFGQAFGIHNLVLEDIMNSYSRPKVEFFDDYFFLTLKIIEFDHLKIVNIEQLSIIVGEGYVLTFQERPGDTFDPIREKIRTSKGKVRKKAAAFLAYLILDNVIDNYIEVSEAYGPKIQELETRVLNKPKEVVLRRILALRNELMRIKQNVDPLKEAVSAIQREIDPDIAKYYRDLHDHVVTESDGLVFYREMLTNLLELYHSSMSFKMNNVMKVLTIITSIFVPLTFIVGVYGMNFDNMPELHTTNGYFVVLGVMFALVVFQLFFFRRKKWL